MKTLTINFIALSLLFITTIACSQKTPEEIKALNEVQKAKNKAMMMSSERHDGYTLSDYTLLVASQKGKTSDGKPCLLVKHPSETSWRPLETEIQYFLYEEGYEYKVSFKEKKYDDSSKSVEYTLTSVDSKVKKKSDLRTEDTKPLFEETTWTITQFDEKPVKNGYLKFQSAQEVGMYLGCNGIGGIKMNINEKAKSIKIILDKAMMTCMACPDKIVMENESKVWKILGEVNNYEATPTELILKNDQRVLMRLKR